MPLTRASGASGTGIQHFIIGYFIIGYFIIDYFIIQYSPISRLDATWLCMSFSNGLKRRLLPRTRVAHKTGTLSGFRNDAGIIYVDDQQHVAVTVFAEWESEAVKDDAATERQRMYDIDSAFGHIARAIFDYYTN